MQESNLKHQPFGGVSWQRPVEGRGPLGQASRERNIKNTTSLYPLIALALAACGGGGSSPAPNRGGDDTDPTEHPPVLTLNGSQTLVLNEGTLTRTMATGYSVSATDEDGDNVRFFSRDSRFDIASDGTLNVLANARFNFEDEPVVMLAITAIDDSDLALSTARTVEIMVMDVTGDPVISVLGRQRQLDEGPIAAETATGYIVSATDEDGDNVSFTITGADGTVDTRFAIADDGTLNIVAGSVFDYEAEANPEGVIILTITATDDSTDALTTTEEVTITVTDVIFSNGLTLASVSDNAAPAFGDVDGDGDMDVLIGDDAANLTFYRWGEADGTGTDWSEQTLPTGLSSEIPGTHATPAFGDVDGDDDIDLLVGNSNGRLSFFRRDEESGGTLSWMIVNDDDLPIVGSSEVSVAPAFGDVDGDGDDDLLVGVHDGTLNFFRRGTDSDGEVTWTQVTGEGNNPFHAADDTSDFDVGGTATPTFGDVDGDGDMDVLVGDGDGNLNFFRWGEATDSAETPGTGWSVQTGSTNPFDESDVGTRAAPTFGDVDGDGDIDLVVGNGEGTLTIWYWLEDDTWSQTNDII